MASEHKGEYSDYFTLQRRGDVAVVTFEVRTILDTTTIQQVANDLYELVDRYGYANIILDMTGVRFLSSQAMGTLVNLLRKTRTLGGKLALVGIGNDIGRVFRVTKLDRLFVTCQSVMEALVAISAPQAAQQMMAQPQPAATK